MVTGLWEDGKNMIFYGPPSHQWGAEDFPWGNSRQAPQGAYILTRSA